jgi:hypothetical protein
VLWLPSKDVISYITKTVQNLPPHWSTSTCSVSATRCCINGDTVFPKKITWHISRTVWRGSGVASLASWQPAVTHTRINPAHRSLQCITSSWTHRHPYAAAYPRWSHRLESSGCPPGFGGLALYRLQIAAHLVASRRVCRPLAVFAQSTNPQAVSQLTDARDAPSPSPPNPQAPKSSCSWPTRVLPLACPIYQPPQGVLRSLRISFYPLLLRIYLFVLLGSLNIWGNLRYSRIMLLIQTRYVILSSIFSYNHL